MLGQGSLLSSLTSCLGIADGVPLLPSVYLGLFSMSSASASFLALTLCVFTPVTVLPIGTVSGCLPVTPPPHSWVSGPGCPCSSLTLSWGIQELSSQPPAPIRCLPGVQVLRFSSQHCSGGGCCVRPQRVKDLGCSVIPLHVCEWPAEFLV